MGKNPSNNILYELLLTNLDLYIVGDLVIWLVVDWLARHNGLLSVKTENGFLSSEKIRSLQRNRNDNGGAFNWKSLDCQSLCNIQKNRIPVQEHIHLSFY